MTSKALSIGFAACILVAGTGSSIAAEDPDFVGPEPRNAATQPVATDAATTGSRDVMKEKDGYFAALDKCDRLEGVAQKQQCVDSVRKEFGQM